MSLTGKKNLGEKKKKQKIRKKKKSEITARQQFHKFGKTVSCQCVFINCYIGNEVQSIEKMVGEQDHVNRLQSCSRQVVIGPLKNQASHA